MNFSNKNINKLKNFLEKFYQSKGHRVLSVKEYIHSSGMPGIIVNTNCIKVYYVICSDLNGKLYVEKHNEEFFAEKRKVIWESKKNYLFGIQQDKPLEIIGIKLLLSKSNVLSK